MGNKKVILTILFISTFFIKGFCINDSLKAKLFYERADSFFLNARYDSSNFYFIHAQRLYKQYNRMDKYIECYKDIACNYMTLGDLDTAIYILNKGISEADTVLQNDNVVLGYIYNILGEVYRHLSLYDKAIEAHTQALSYKIKHWGDIHPTVATSYHNIAIIYSSKGDYEQSLLYNFRSLEIRIKTLPPNHPYFSKTYNNIGNIYGNMFEYEKALEYYFKALADREKILVANHPDIAETLANIAILYGKTERYEESLIHFEKALKIWQEHYGENHALTSSTYQNLGNLYFEQKKIEKANIYHNRSLEINKTLFGFHHPSISDNYTALAKSSHFVKYFEEAIRYYNLSICSLIPDCIEMGPLASNSINFKNILSKDKLLTVLYLKGECYFDKWKQID